MQKYEKDYTAEDFENLVQVCQKIGINIHYYIIFGFPTETKDEIKATSEFLKNQLKEHKFFSYTTGDFGLNKGSYVYDHPQEYGVSYKDSKQSVFIYEYYEKSFQENKKMRDKTSTQLRENLFF